MRMRFEFVVGSAAEIAQTNRRTKNLLFEDMIDGFPVNHGSCAAGVVRHHAANGGPAGGGDIGREVQAVLFE